MPSPVQIVISILLTTTLALSILLFFEKDTVDPVALYQGLEKTFTDELPRTLGFGSLLEEDGKESQAAQLIKQAFTLPL